MVIWSKHGVSMGTVSGSLLRLVLQRVRRSGAIFSFFQLDILVIGPGRINFGLGSRHGCRRMHILLIYKHHK